jgi:ankyrin repeat protein
MMKTIHQLCGKESGRLSVTQEEKHLEELKLLMLRPETDLNVGDDSGRTILHYASGFGYQKVILHDF